MSCCEGEEKSQVTKGTLNQSGYSKKVKDEFVRHNGLLTKFTLLSKMCPTYFAKFETEIDSNLTVKSVATKNKLFARYQVIKNTFLLLDVNMETEKTDLKSIENDFSVKQVYGDNTFTASVNANKKQNQNFSFGQKASYSRKINKDVNVFGDYNSRQKHYNVGFSYNF